MDVLNSVQLCSHSSTNLNLSFCVSDSATTTTHLTKKKIFRSLFCVRKTKSNFNRFDSLTTEAICNVTIPSNDGGGMHIECLSQISQPFIVRICHELFWLLSSACSFAEGQPQCRQYVHLPNTSQFVHFVYSGGGQCFATMQIRQTCHILRTTYISSSWHLHQHKP